VETTWNLHRYAALMRHWSREGPPAYIAVAAYLGLRPARGGDNDQCGGQDLANFLATFPGGERA
jgi:hypothetical protein